MSGAYSGTRLLAKFHKVIVQSMLPDANILPSGLKAMLAGSDICSFMSCPIACLDATSQMMILPSIQPPPGPNFPQPPEARVLPSRLKATLHTPCCFVCPSRGWPMGWCVATSHRMTLPSQLPEAKIVPSGLKATLLTWLVWPRRMDPRRCCVATSQRVIVLSSAPEARVFPSGLKLRLSGRAYFIGCGPRR